MQSKAENVCGSYREKQTELELALLSLWSHLTTIWIKFRIFFLTIWKTLKKKNQFFKEMQVLVAFIPKKSIGTIIFIRDCSTAPTKIKKKKMIPLPFLVHC